MDVLNQDQVVLVMVGFRNSQVSQPQESLAIQIFDPDNNIQESQMTGVITLFIMIRFELCDTTSANH